MKTGPIQHGQDRQAGRQVKAGWYNMHVTLVCRVCLCEGDSLLW